MQKEQIKFNTWILKKLSSPIKSVDILNTPIPRKTVLSLHEI